MYFIYGSTRQTANFAIFTDVGNRMPRHADIKRTLNFDPEDWDLNLCFAQKQQPDFGIVAEHWLHLVFTQEKGVILI